MDVDAVQEHLAAPVLGALDQLGVAPAVGDALAPGAREGVGARGGEVDAQPSCDGGEEVDARGDVGQAVGHGGPGLGGDLDGVEQHLAVDPREELAVDGGLVDDGVRALAQIVGVLVDQLELPFDSEGGPGGPAEWQGHRGLLLVPAPPSLAGAGPDGRICAVDMRLAGVVGGAGMGPGRASMARRRPASVPGLSALQ